MSDIKRFFGINWLWLMAVTIVVASLPGTRFMQENWVYWILGCEITILIAIIIFDITRKAVTTHYS